MNRFEMSDMGYVSRVLGMNVTQKEAVTISQKDYKEDVVQF